MMKKVGRMMAALLALVLTLTLSGVVGAAGAEGLSTKVEVLEVFMPLVGGGPTTDLAEVEKAINEYIEPLIYANIHLTYIPYAQWESQMNMSVATGEQVDLMCTVREISGYYKNGALLPLDDYLDKYGAGIRQYVDQVFIDSCTFGGEIYGIPTLRDMAKQQVYEYSVAVAEKYGLEMKETMTFDELEEQFMKMKEQAPDTPCLLLTNGKRTFDSWCGWDAIGDNYGVIMMGQQDTQLVNLFESEEYYSLLKRMEKWFAAGIINQEAPTADIQWADIIPTGSILGRFARSKPGYELQETVRYGVDLKTCKIMDPILDSAQVQFMAWAVPVSSAYPEKAVALMNLFYSDPVVINLMSYGIEGKHYEIKDAETGIIGYPEGVTTATFGYAPGMNYGVGNELIGYVWEGNEADIWAQLDQFNKSANASPVLGFAFDNSSVVNEISACNNVLAKYAVSMEIGCVNVDEELPKFQQELKSAGIEKIIAEKQKQIDAWYAANKGQ